MSKTHGRLLHVSATHISQCDTPQQLQQLYGLCMPTTSRVCPFLSHVCCAGHRMRQRDDDASSSSASVASEQQRVAVRPSAVQRLLGNVHVAGPEGSRCGAWLWRIAGRSLANSTDSHAFHWAGWGAALVVWVNGSWSSVASLGAWAACTL